MDTQMYQATQAYIHILETEITDRPAFYARVHRANDWYVDLEHFIFQINYEQTCELTEFGIREGYLQCLSDKQFTRLLSIMSISLDARSPIYQLTKARLREGFELTTEQREIIVKRINPEKLIASMIRAPPPDEANMYEFCTIVGLSPKLAQHGCRHTVDGFKIICNRCFDYLCVQHYDDEHICQFVAERFYVPEKYFDELSVHSNIPESVIHDWGVKNARFRELRIIAVIFMEYQMPERL